MLQSRQPASLASRFLEACRKRNSGEIDEEELRRITVTLGFNNVIDAFHRLGPAEIPKKFFIDERGAGKGIRLTDELRTLGEIIHPNDLMRETEARWRLVETAWGLGVSRSLIAFDPESENFFVQWRDGRIVVTSARSALNRLPERALLLLLRSNFNARRKRRSGCRPLFPVGGASASSRQQHQRYLEPRSSVQGVQ
jgi:hypothetical protein